MYRNGVFYDLRWDDITNRRGTKWDTMKSEWNFLQSYNLGCTDPWNPLLYRIAECCVDECRELLFSLTPVTCLKEVDMSSEIQLDFSVNTRSVMASRLKTALCDHLVISFAYRFLCENLIPKTIAEYCDDLYCCQRNWDYMGVRASQTAARMEFRKTVRRMYKDFCMDLGIGESNAGINTNQTILSFLKYVNDVDSRDLFCGILEQDLQEETLPPPCAWFILAFIFERDKFLKIFDEKKNKDFYIALANFVRESRFFKVLMIEENVEEDLYDVPSLWTKYGMLFSGIPFDSDMGIVSGIPDKTYELQLEGFKENVRITVTARLQTMLNNYLLERNFHLYTTATAMSVLYSDKRVAKQKCPYTEAGLMLTNIHAPLVHSTFISLLKEPGELREESYLLEAYVKRWNREALPVLEELFICRVKETMNQKLEVVDAINECANADFVYERVNFIRALRTNKRIWNSEKNKANSDFINELVIRTFSLYENLE